MDGPEEGSKTRSLSVQPVSAANVWRDTYARRGAESAPSSTLSGRGRRTEGMARSTLDFEDDGRADPGSAVSGDEKEVGVAVDDCVGGFEGPDERSLGAMTTSVSVPSKSAPDLDGGVSDTAPSTFLCKSMEFV
jgi:hypothetical protein